MYDLITKELPAVLKEANLGLVRDLPWRGVVSDMSPAPFSIPILQSCIAQMECAVPALVLWRKRSGDRFDLKSELETETGSWGRSVH
jgi:hypothetical protein